MPDTWLPPVGTGGGDPQTDESAFYVGGGLTGFSTLVQFQGIASAWVRQDVTILLEGWVRPKCSGPPDTYRYHTIKEAFRMRGGASGTSNVVQLSPWSQPGQLGTVQWLDNKRAIFDRNTCDLCRFRFFIIAEWYECSLGGPGLNPAIDYVLIEEVIRCRGCLCSQGRGASDSSKQGPNASAVQALAGAGLWTCDKTIHYDGYFGYWDICPCGTGSSGKPDKANGNPRALPDPTPTAPPDWLFASEVQGPTPPVLPDVDPQEGFGVWRGVPGHDVHPAVPGAVSDGVPPTVFTGQPGTPQAPFTGGPVTVPPVPPGVTAVPPPRVPLGENLPPLVVPEAPFEFPTWPDPSLPARRAPR